MRRFPPEFAHHLALKTLQQKWVRTLPTWPMENIGHRCQMEVPGIGTLAHPIGLAAGFDKDANAIEGLRSLGFSFLEIGTITPLAQSGNPKPRVFRRSSQRSLINRLGFPSDGSTTVKGRLQKAQRPTDGIPIAANLGKNRETSNEFAIDDYLKGFEALLKVTDFSVINISSPNTPGLRSLQSPEFIGLLSDRLGPDRARAWLKFDPDLPRGKFQDLIAATQTAGFAGLVLTNTHRVQLGGESGHPLMTPATTCLEWAYEVHRGELPMIGVGGILSGLDIFEKVARGAQAVEIYTALVYRGPWAVGLLLEELCQELDQRGIECLSDAVGIHYRGDA